MLKQHNHLSEGSVPYAIERDRVILNKMYPDVTNFESKYILFVEFSLFWNYLFDEMNCAVTATNADGTIINEVKTKIRHIWPNKNYYTVCMKVGKKLCDDGIVFIFDSFEQLCEIKQLQCVWDIVSQNINIYVQSVVDVSFKKEIDKHVYAIRSQEVIMNDDKDYSSKIREYDKYIVIKNNPNDSSVNADGIEFNNITGRYQPIKSMFREHALVPILFDVLYSDKLAEPKFSDSPKQLFIIAYYFCDAVLSPDVCKDAIV